MSGFVIGLEKAPKTKEAPFPMPRMFYAGRGDTSRKEDAAIFRTELDARCAAASIYFDLKVKWFVEPVAASATP